MFAENGKVLANGRMVSDVYLMEVKAPADSKGEWDYYTVKATIPGAHSKNLFVKDKKGRIFLITAEGDAAIDLKAISEKIGASGRVSFGKPELLLELVGVTPGSVTPFGVINDVEGRVTVVVDAAMMSHEILNFHPLENTATTSIRREDFVRFLEAVGHPPLIVAVSEGRIASEE